MPIHHQSEHTEVDHTTGRPVIRGRNGIVATGHYLTSMAAMRQLLSDGNAFDAAVAACVAAAVVEPTASYSLAAEGVGMFYHAASQQLAAVSGQGVAPRLATIEAVPAPWAGENSHRARAAGASVVHRARRDGCVLPAARNLWQQAPGGRAGPSHRVRRAGLPDVRIHAPHAGQPGNQGAVRSLPARRHGGVLPRRFAPGCRRLLRPAPTRRHPAPAGAGRGKRRRLSTGRLAGGAVGVLRRRHRRAHRGVFRTLRRPSAA